jgi:hypothetical protein
MESNNHSAGCRSDHGPAGKYNRKVKSAAFCLAALLLAGCSKNIDTTEAVRDGIIKDISKKVDVGTMDVTVDSVSFREKEADATVSFTPKGAPRSQSMVMSYALERQGDEWKIKSRSMLTPHDRVQGSNGQPGQTALPPGHPSVAAPPGGTPLPPGHPSTGNLPKQ